MRYALPVEVRFHTKYIINDVTDCWVWSGAYNNIGYGMFRFDTKTMRTAHRVSYELHKGPIPNGLCVCHKCDNPKCVNPDHLWVGTVYDNMHDKIDKGRCNQVYKKGYKVETKECPHCTRMMPINTINRWHNDNCKQKSGSINTISTDQQKP